MANYSVYRDIAERTGGNIYIGVVGPVRTGKSTFIKSFMDSSILPAIENTYVRERAKDELPQSAAGKTIMTTEPKFVPEEAVEIKLGENTKCRVRLIDCVGYLVDGAEGYMEENNPRMVSTPWSKEKMSFAEAAETGTKKVITDHSTMGIVVFTDGSVTGIDRKNYREAEEKVISQLKEINKPFVILLNSADPKGENAQKLAEEISQKYSAPVKAVNCTRLSSEDIDEIMELALHQFPLTEVKINIPRWIESLENEHRLKKSIIESVSKMAQSLTVIKDVKDGMHFLQDNEFVKKAALDSFDASTGTAEVEVAVNDDLFFGVLSETTGVDIEDEYELFSIMRQLSDAKKGYDKIKFALDEVNRKGYGIVSPDSSEIRLERPQLVKQGNRYGIKINAEAPGIHMIKTDIKACVSPIVGNEQQSAELVKSLTEQYNEAAENVLDYSIFGRSIGELINDDLNSKLLRMSEDTQLKFRETIQKIINEGSGGMICILL